MKKEKEVIMYDSDKAAQIKTVTGWVDRNGRFWGKDEHMARYSGSTNSKCECGEIIDRGWTNCRSCRDRKHHEKYKEIEFKEWDGKSPLCLWNDDKYFWDIESIHEYVEEIQHDNPDFSYDDLQLMLCRRSQEYTQIPHDYWDEYCDQDGEQPDNLMEIISEFNEKLSKLEVTLWFQDKYRTSIKNETT